MVPLLLLLTACGKAGSPQTSTPSIPTGTGFPPTVTVTVLSPSATAEPPTATVPQASDTPSLTPTEERLSLPAFIPGDCRFGRPGDFVECGDLVVLEDRDDPGGPTVSLHVAIIHSSSTDPEPDPVIYLMGGAGGNALSAVDYYLSMVGNQIRASRDFIMYNQRGTHLNQPVLKCPGEKAFQLKLESQDISKEEADALEEEFVLGCRDYLLEQGVNLEMYNSVTNAADANDLRIALGYDKVNFYGTSYGTRLGLTILRNHPEGVRSMILDSVFPPNIDYPSEAITSMMLAVDRIFETCAADTDCNSQYPALEETFYQVLDDLHNNPDKITIGGYPVVVDDEIFLDAIYMALHPATAIPDIPRAIQSASQGDFHRLEWAIESLMGYSENVATGVYYSSVCRDEVGLDSYENSLALAGAYHPRIAAYFELSSFFSTCEKWGAGDPDPVENEAVVSDIPALIFAGYYDPITSTEWCQLAAETLSNSYYYEFPNMGHGVMRADQCALNIGLQFLDDPTTEPDASCMEGLGYPNFK
jgi:pimeloyl-ACP methyl ester carboxylesterase